MTLLELLRQELPKRGGWPEGVVKIHQDYDGETWAWLNHDTVKRLFTLDQVATNARKFGKREKCENMVARDQYESVLAASQKPAWNGEGLPPVGCECEYMKHTRNSGNNWSKGTVKYIGEFTVVIDDDDVDGEVIAHPLGCAFRPLRTEAERAIDEMVRLSGVSIGAAKILYDAGYRKA